MLAAAACQSPERQLMRQLEQGRTSVLPCAEQLHDSADEFRDCIRYRAGLARNPEQRLGALFYGWVVADSAAMFSVPEAEPVAAQLAREAESLRRQLAIDDGPLCRLAEAPCPRLQARRASALKPE
ncbi:hypothetical protein D0B54_17595 [Solimonas sp. K1W22B-7]|uniref:hypothetical protein n=1 Tax=Solimonas sp. K1W22B-7 TaxID=2303331 RepID=UPI000E3341E0|nr:hypothetical protein [Solimonas sp. K1W22B-7]AXQ30375.1 hypothetical protein D0B54_17595 [Solimonas sp. K1W22B-7]